MSSSVRPPEPLERTARGIAGLDRIVQDGFRRGCINLIHGPPGAGKTILANQMAFRHRAAGGRAIYLILLAEIHARMLAYLRPLSFSGNAA